MTTKEYLRRLVDELPDSQLEVALRFLEYLRDTGDPVLHALLTAPEDDEPETEEERAALEDALEDALEEIRYGEGRAWEEVRGELAGER